MSYGTAQRNKNTGALYRSKGTGGIRRNAWSPNAACCCQGTSGSGSGSGPYCPCGSGQYHRTFTVTVVGSLALSSGDCVVDLGQIYQPPVVFGSIGMYPILSCVDPSISGSCCVTVGSDCCGVASMDTIFHTEHYLIYGTNQVVSNPCPTQNPPCSPPALCDPRSGAWPQSGSSYQGHYKGLLIKLCSWFDTQAAIGNVFVSVTPKFYDCQGRYPANLNPTPDRPLVAAGQLACGDTTTLTLSPRQWCYTPPLGCASDGSPNGPGYANITGTVTISDLATC